MPRAFPIVFCLTLGTAACARGTRDASAPGPLAPEAKATSAVGGSTAVPAGTTAGEGASTVAAPALSPPVGVATWEPAPPSALTHDLRAEQIDILSGRRFKKLATENALRALLVPSVGGFKASGAVSSTVRAAQGWRQPVAARNYVAGKKTARIRVLDTAETPEARREVGRKLTLIGNEAAGNERGLLVLRRPAVTSHLRSQRVDRATMLAGGRYLVDVIVRESSEPGDAIALLEVLDWSGLVPE